MPQHRDNCPRGYPSNTSNTAASRPNRHAHKIPLIFWEHPPRREPIRSVSISPLAGDRSPRPTRYGSCHKSKRACFCPGPKTKEESPKQTPVRCLGIGLFKNGIAAGRKRIHRRGSPRRQWGASPGFFRHDSPGEPYKKIEQRNQNETIAMQYSDTVPSKKCLKGRSKSSGK